MTLRLASVAALAALTVIVSPLAAQNEPVSLDIPAPLPANQLMEGFGWLVGKQLGLQELGFTEEELASFVAGMQAARAGAESPAPVQQVQMQLQQVMQARQQAYMEGLQTRNRETQAAYFAELDAKPEVQRTPSGLRYEVLTPGSEEKPVATSRVTVNYTGRLIDGTVFDSSEGRGPATFGLNQVIRGWTEGMQLIGKGGRIRLHVPSDLGYGDQGQGGSIPPSSALVFEVDLLDIQAPDAPPAAPDAPSMN